MKKRIETLQKVLVCTGSSHRPILKLLLEEIGVQQISFVKNINEAKLAIAQFDPDLCFLDAEIAFSPEALVKLARLIHGTDCGVPTIFMVASFNSEASQKLKALPCSTVMTKEFSFQSMLTAIEYAMLKRENNRLSKNLESVSVQKRVLQVPKDITSGPMFFKVGDKFRRIKQEQIDFFYAENKMTYARVGPRNFPTNTQLKTLEEKLNPYFLRCHKKYLINIDKIDSIFIKDDKVKLGSEILPIGYVYRKPFLGSLDLLR
jgi:DNA-binding LytR/AlgR family response regulator